MTKTRTVDKLLLLHRALADENLLKVDVTVLAILIEATNTKHGYSWAAVPTIAATARISKRYARQVIRKLESFGYVRVEIGGRGPKSTSRYFVNLQGGTTRSPLAIPKRNAKGELNGAKGEPAVPLRGNQQFPRTLLDNPLTKNPSAPAASPTSGDAPPAKEKREQTEEQKVAAELRRIERKMQSVGDISDEEAEWLEEIAESYDGTSGDPLGGWAYRLLTG